MKKNKKIRRIVHFIEYLFFLFFVKLISFLPIKISYKLADIFAVFLRILKIRKKTIEKNLNIVFGKVEKDLIPLIYKNLCYLFVEFVIYTNRKPKFIVNNEEFIKDVLKKDTPIIIVTPHLGSWEITGHYLTTATDKTISAIAKPIHNPFINKYIEKTRKDCGFNLIYTRKNMLISLKKSIKEKHIICFLADQNAKKRGIKIPFFSKPASTFTGPAVLSLKFNLPVVFGYCVRDKNKNFIINLEKVIYPHEFFPEKSRKEREYLLLKEIALLTERSIRKYPDQWFWVHNRWD